MCFQKHFSLHNDNAAALERYSGSPHSVFISTAGVKELMLCNYAEKGVKFGAALTITQLEHVLSQALTKYTRTFYAPFVSFLYHKLFRYFNQSLHFMFLNLQPKRMLLSTWCTGM